MLRPNPRGLGRKISIDVMSQKNRVNGQPVNSGKGEFSSGVSESSVVLNVCEEYAPWWCRKSKAAMPRGTEWTVSMGSRPKLAQLDTSFCLHPIRSSNAVESRETSPQA